MYRGDEILPFVRCFTASHQHICGKTRWASRTTSHKGREGSKGGPCCRCCSSTESCAREDARWRESLHVLGRCVRDLPTRTGLGGLPDSRGGKLAHSQIQLHHEKTQVWNRAGVAPPRVDSLTRKSRVAKADAIVWRGDVSLQLEQRGVKILGVPVGQPEYVAEHETLFERIPPVGDTQAAWLLLLMCASTRANFWLRSVNQT